MGQGLWFAGFGTSLAVAAFGAWWSDKMSTPLLLLALLGACAIMLIGAIRARKDWEKTPVSCVGPVCGGKAFPRKQMRELSGEGLYCWECYEFFVPTLNKTDDHNL